MAGPAADVSRSVVALVLATAFVSCGRSSGGETTGGGAPSTGPRAVLSLPGVSTTFQPQTSGVAARFEFVDYSVTGGIAGLSDHLKVYPDGRVAYHDGRRESVSTIPLAAVAELRAALEAADLVSLPPVSGSPTPDARAYRVIFGGQAVRFYDGSMPPSLAPAMAILTRELNRAKQQR